MSKSSTVCTCQNCPGSTCQCGCQHQATASTTTCQCGDACACGETCACGEHCTCGDGCTCAQGGDADATRMECR